jgi:hypothetical protein
MPRKIFHLGFCLILFYGCGIAQHPVNFDFELINRMSGSPEGISSTHPDSYSLTFDSLVKQHGKYSAVLEQKDPNAGVGSFAFIIDQKFSGKKLTLKGYIRTENVSAGFAGLLLWVDGYAGVHSFDNMASQQLRGTNDWKEYSITIGYNGEEAKDIHVGAMLVGKGKIWLDNFQLLVDDKDFSLAPVYKGVLHKADLDTAFLNGSGVQLVGR